MTNNEKTVAYFKKTKADKEYTTAEIQRLLEKNCGINRLTCIAVTLNECRRQEFRITANIALPKQIRLKPCYVTRV